MLTTGVIFFHPISQSQGARDNYCMLPAASSLEGLAAYRAFFDVFSHVAPMMQMAHKEEQKPNDEQDDTKDNWFYRDFLFLHCVTIPGCRVLDVACPSLQQLLATRIANVLFCEMEGERMPPKTQLTASEEGSLGRRLRSSSVGYRIIEHSARPSKRSRFLSRGVADMSYTNATLESKSDSPVLRSPDQKNSLSCN